MKKIINEYQLSKTIRFGLTKKEKVRKPNYDGEIFESHKELDELIKISEERIKNSVFANSNSEKDILPIEQIEKCLVSITNFIRDWQQFYKRKDQIAIDKDYYKILCNKIGLDKNKKLPSQRNIKLNEIKGNSNEIINYWESNILNAYDKFNIVNERVKQYKTALELNRSDNKPNEVDLRKSFLTLANITIEILKPLFGQINFPDVNKLDSSIDKNKKLIDFASNFNSRMDLLKEINKLKAYFEDNGGNVPLLRATLNPNTAIKNPKSTDNSIDPEIKKLGFDNIFSKYNNVLEYENYLASLTCKEKINIIKNKKEDLFTRGLLFKYKTILASVQLDLAQILSEKLNKNEEDLFNFIISIGQPKSPSKDYAELLDKNDFDIDVYPLKTSFDFAWEELAKALHHPEVNFPTKICEKFLKDNFNVDVETNKNFLNYANLIELNAVISTLQNGKPKNEYEFKHQAQELLDNIDFNDKNKYLKQNIENWLNNKKQSVDINKTKQKLGLFRGSLKNNIKSYYSLTQEYKQIAMSMGKTFADMRDKIYGAADLNKVSHYAMIIEDQRNDKYILLQEFTEKEADRIYSKTNNDFNDFFTYQVKSVTSKSIAKMISKIRIEELKKSNNHQQKEMSDEAKEKQNIKEWTEFVRDKYWDYEFGLNFKNKNFEEIKKEIDSKCYKLQKKSIDKETLFNLVKNGNCLLLPIINKDLVKEVKTEKNQFTKDWNDIFDDDKTNWRLTPEFRITYRKPTPGYPESNVGDKRYSRFQLNSHFLCDYIPKSSNYISSREQIENYKDDKKQENAVKKFHDKLQGKTEEELLKARLKESNFNFKIKENKKNSKDPKQKEEFYVFGIDRGQKELATLCVIDQDKKIIGDFDIYTRYFNTDTKEWNHKFLEKRHILDLSNLRVETTVNIDGKPKREKVLVDLSEVKVKDKKGKYTKSDKMQIKMQQLAYIRMLQFEMQTNPETVLEWYKNNNTREDVINNFVDKPNGEKGLTRFYGAEVDDLKYTLPVDKILDMLKTFKKLKDKEVEGEDVKKELDQLVQLEPVDNLKSGVVANMVGVISHLLEKFDYNVYISLEDLSNPFDDNITGGIGGVPIKVNKGEGRRVDVEKYAGLGLYNFFEMQLLKKLFRIQKK